MRLKSPKLLNSILGILAFLFLFHVLISAAMIFSPIVSNIFEKNILTRYYKDYTALGPFFTVKSVRSTYYLGYNYKTNKWSEVVYPVIENHQKYLRRGGYTWLKRAEFEKYLAGSVYSDEKEGIKQHENYMVEYLLDEYLHDRSMDSVRVLVLKDFYSGKKLQTDTIRNIKYRIHQK